MECLALRKIRKKGNHADYHDPRPSIGTDENPHRKCNMRNGQITKEYRIVCDHVKQYSQHVESTKPKGYKQTPNRSQSEAEHTTSI